MRFTVTKAGSEVELSIDYKPNWRGNQYWGLRHKSRDAPERASGVDWQGKLQPTLMKFWISNKNTSAACPTRHSEAISSGRRINWACPQC
jgi:hypothetical protein